ncbi:unnamed protein product [Hydatigera taeniaeformis]|uniref:CDGSH iron-sulfur domain-containing protein 3, mitochondrial n=1 Tax=Hydatigena taeniaeformis TaxID=6205 RepID=A0A0R3X7I4_HYDTA|nr:unnamed protein product [Hydatigera taeniaeformis]
MLSPQISLSQKLLLPVLSTRGGRFLAPGSYYIPFSERFDEEGNRRPSPHPETPKFRGIACFILRPSNYNFILLNIDIDELPPAKEPKIAGKHPFRFVCEAKKIYWWCACGQSKEQPFCDGHHSRTIHKWPVRNQKPMFKPIKITFEKKTVAWFCMCKQTGSPPFCDGSHNCELVQTAFKY